MFCKHCGNVIQDDATICPNCNSAVSNSQAQNKESESKSRCLPSFILGLMGSIFGLFGGICTTMCSFGSSSNSAFIFIFGGSLLGLIGACQCLKNAKSGSIIETASACLIIFRAFSKNGADFMTVIALLLLLSGGLIGLICAFAPKRK